MNMILRNGLKKGLNTTWDFAKIVVPVYIIITFLQHTPIIQMIAGIFEPALHYLGLPGKAAIVLVLGNLTNLYAALGVIPALGFTFKEITILSLMLSFSHSLIMETAVMKRIGASVIKLNALRIGLAVISGLVINLLWR
jgi:Fe2+ transport system protein B